MKIEVACAWGDGPDVAMNLHPSDEDKEGFAMFGDDLIPVDLTAEMAYGLAFELMAAALEAKKLRQIAEAHDESGNHISHGIDTEGD